MGRSNNTAIRGRRSGSSRHVVGQSDTSKVQSDSSTGTEKVRPAFQEHPLLNAVILTRTLEFLKPDFKDLKQLRQVCKLWYELTLFKWRSTAVIKIVPEPLFFNKTNIEGMTVVEFFHELQNPQTFLEFLDNPFSRYKFKGIRIDINACDDGDSKTFWELIGPQVKYVHFQDCVFPCTRDKVLTQLLVRKMPNVTDVVLTDVKSKNGDEKVMFKTFKKCHKNLKALTIQGECDVDLTDVFILAPNLETITGRDGDKTEIGDFEILDDIEITATHLTQFKKPTTRYTFLPSLKHLDLIKASTLINGMNTGLRLERFARGVNLNLESLSLRLEADASCGVPMQIMRPRVPITTINLFIAAFTKSLQVLRIFRAPICPPLGIFLCDAPMPTLRELCLWGSVVPRFHFLKCTPNLKVLYINMSCFEKREELEQVLRKERRRRNYARYERYNGDMTDLVCEHWMENVALPHLNSLHIDFPFPVKSLRMMAEWMPNLKVLKTILTKQTVPVVCKQWPNLVELVCLPESSIENCNIICKIGKGGRGGTIGDLQFLERFQLDAVCEGSSLSDACVYDGFLKMPSLKSVQICVGRKMTEKAEQDMKNGIEECRVIRNYSGGDHSNYDCCARTKFDLDCANGLPTLKYDGWKKILKMKNLKKIQPKMSRCQARKTQTDCPFHQY